MAISFQLRQSIENGLDEIYAEGFRAALDLISDYRAGLYGVDEVGEDDGYDQNYLDGLEDAIRILEQNQ